jgi:WD40 repeat protein
VTLWDVASGREVLTLTGHTRTVTTLQFTPDGQRLITATGLGLWDMVLGDLPAEAFFPAQVKVWDGGPAPKR